MDTHNDRPVIPPSVEDAKTELAEIEAWLQQVQVNLPLMQQRGAYLHGFIAAKEQT